MELTDIRHDTGRDIQAPQSRFRHHALKPATVEAGGTIYVLPQQKERR